MIQFSSQSTKTRIIVANEIIGYLKELNQKLWKDYRYSIVKAHVSFELINPDIELLVKLRFSEQLATLQKEYHEL